MPNQVVSLRGYEKMYPAEVEFGKEEGDNGGDSVSLDNDFVLVQIRWQIIQDGNTPNAPIQDGNFRLGWSIQRTTRFYKGPDPMAFTYGSPTFGYWQPLSVPIKIGVNRTLEVELTNTVTRTDKAVVQVTFVGVEPDPDAPEKF